MRFNQPFVFVTGTKMVQPSEFISLNGSSWEEQVDSLVKDVFEPCGFTVELFTRVPYLCEGDLYREFYVLDDALFVLKTSEWVMETSWLVKETVIQPGH